MKAKLHHIRVFISSDSFTRYANAVGWMFFSRILSLSTSLLAILFTARSLGPEGFGELSYATSVVGLFGFLVTLGIDNILYRDIIKHPEKEEQYLGTAFLLRVISGVSIASLITLFQLLFGESGNAKTLIIILSWTFAWSAFQIIPFSFQSRVRTKGIAAIATVVPLILNGMKILAIIAHKGNVAIACVLFLEPIFYAIAYVALYQRTHPGHIFHWKVSIPYARDLLKDSIPVIALSAFTMIYARIDQVIIKHLLNTSAVGIYDAAVRISELWSFVPGFILGTIYPAILNAKKVSPRLYYERFINTGAVLTLLAIAVSTGITIFAPYIIKTLYGPQFTESIAVLRIYSWAFIGTSLGIVATQYLITENLRFTLALSIIPPTVINILLNILWIPRYGVIGAAYATLIAYSIAPLTIFLFREVRANLDMIRQKE